MATTRALVVTRHGGPEVLAVEEREVAEPGPGEALVEVAAGGVNFIDVYQREGIYPTEPPYVAGFEAAGTVRAVGEGACRRPRETARRRPRNYPVADMRTAR